MPGRANMPGPFRWWGWLLSPLNLIGALLSAPLLFVLWLGDDYGFRAARKRRRREEGR